MESISYKIREGHLCCFGHFLQRRALAPVRRVECLSVVGKRKRSSLRRTWVDWLNLDMEALNLTGDTTLDRPAWR